MQRYVKPVEGMTLLPDAELLSLAEGEGLVASGLPLNAAFTAVAHTLRADGVAAAPDPLDIQRRTLTALEHPQHPAHAAVTARWRALLAFCLLQDVWDVSGRLETVTIGPDACALAGAVLCASGRAEPIRLVVWQGEDGNAVLGMAHPVVGLIPAAQPEGIAACLPERADWFDPDTNAMDDPSPWLNEHDRAVLLRRLSLLGGAAAVTAFAADLAQAGLRAAQEINREDEAACRALMLRLKAVAGLAPERDFAHITTAVEAYRAGATVNALLRCLGILEKTAPERFPLQRIWLWQGKPFARSSRAVGLESTGDVREDDALDALEKEIAALEMHSPRWRYDLAQRLAVWLEERRDDRLLSPAVRHMADTLRRDATADAVAMPLHLSWPWQGADCATRLLIRETLGDDAAEAVHQPFADRLLLIPGGEGMLLGDAALARVCTLPAQEDAPACAVLPPIAPALAEKIAASPSLLVQEAMSFRAVEGGVRATLCLRGGECVTLERLYAPEEILRLPYDSAPTLAVWPCLPLPAERWHAYYTYFRGGSLRAEIWDGAGWHGTEDRLFSVLRTHRLPGMIMLYQGQCCLGAAPNLLPDYELPPGENVTAAVDFGASGAAVALLEGDAARPMQLPALVRTLLCGPRAAEMAADFLPPTPLGPVLPCAVELFGDEPQPLPLHQGHVAMGDMAAAAQVAARRLHCDLKWAADSAERRARRLMMHQVMLTASLAATLAGAPRISWRLVLPEGMSHEGRIALWRDMTDLAPVVAQDTGLHLLSTPTPVSCADESLALGAYLRGEGGVRSGFMAVDLGSGGASAALWLRGMNRPAFTAGMPLGVQAMLVDGLLADPAAPAAEMAMVPDPQAQRDAALLGDRLRSAVGSRKTVDMARWMTETFVGQHLPAITASWQAGYVAGMPGMGQTLTIASAAALMSLIGLMLEQVWRDPLLNDYLPADLTVVLTGRGSSLLTALPQPVQAQLIRFIRLMMSSDHPVRQLRFSPSAMPRSETVLGVLRMQEVHPDGPGRVQRPRPNAALPLPNEQLVIRFLGALQSAFPPVCERLYASLFDRQGMLTAHGEGMIRASLQRLADAGASPEAAFAGCLNELRDLH